MKILLYFIKYKLYNLWSWLSNTPEHAPAEVTE